MFRVRRHAGCGQIKVIVVEGGQLFESAAGDKGFTLPASQVVNDEVSAVKYGVQFAVETGNRLDGVGWQTNSLVDAFNLATPERKGENPLLLGPEEIASVAEATGGGETVGRRSQDGRVLGA